MFLLMMACQGDLMVVKRMLNFMREMNLASVLTMLTTIKMVFLTVMMKGVQAQRIA